MIDDCLRQIRETLDHLIDSNEMLANLLNHPHRQRLSVLTIMIWIGTIWMAYSNIASWRALRNEAAQMASQPAVQKHISSAHASSSCQPTANTGSPQETPVQRKPFPPLKGNVTNGSSSATGNRASFGFGVGKHVDGRTDRVSTPGYQTPLANMPSRRNFSGLLETAPLSYDTLQRNGLLDAEGTPTKKYSPNSLAQDEEEYVQVYDSPTKSWGNIKRSKNGSKEVQRRAVGVEGCLVENWDGGQLQHFLAAKGEWKAS